MKILIECEKHCKRVTIEEGTAFNDESLNIIIREQFSLHDDTKFHLQIFDKDFNDFCDLNSIDEIVNLSKLRVILKDAQLTTAATNDTVTDNKTTENNENRKLRCESWIPGSIKVNIEDFSLPVRNLLDNALKEFLNNNRLYDPPNQVRKECKTVLENILKRYTVYPTSQQYEEVCWALIKEFPCLREPIGSGISGWKIALRYRIEDSRRKSKSLQEVKINAGM